MGDQQNISQILAALAAVRPAVGAQYTTGAAPSSAAPPSTNAGGYALPQPDSTGSLNIGGAAPVNTSSVSIADAIAKARGIAAEKGITYKPTQAQTRDTGRSHRRSRSPSRTPPRTSTARDVFRDGYNPYRDERRGADRRGTGDRGYARERSSSPRPDAYSPQSNRHYRKAGDRSPPPRNRGSGPEDNSETIEIDNKYVGLIIGRQGENLRRIENETGARVQFLDSAEHNKTIRLYRLTGSKLVRDKAKAEIDRVVSEGNQSRGDGRPSDRSGQDGGRSGDGDGSDSMKIMVPDRTVGLVIGRSGETVRDLAERSGCRINIARDGESINGLRPVTLTGSQQAMQRAKELIVGIVESDNRPGNQGQREPRGQAMSADNGGGGGDKLNDKIFIPKEAVGMVIGKGGETIRELQSFSGCKINILPLVGREPEREVTFYGSQTAIDAAKRAVMAKVEAALKNRSQGARRDDSYSQQPQYQQQQSYSQDSNSQQHQQQQQQQQQQAMQAGVGDGTDPYAMYGGYENYMAMWYAAMAQQQQQQQQQQQYPQYPGGGGPPPSGSDQPGPPGVS
ncbi:hypothetical protein MferCBS31731_002830 [Microsporum ferrugineum]